MRVRLSIKASSVAALSLKRFAGWRPGYCAESRDFAIHQADMRMHEALISISHTVPRRSRLNSTDEAKRAFSIGRSDLPRPKFFISPRRPKDHPLHILAWSNPRRTSANPRAKSPRNARAPAGQWRALNYPESSFVPLLLKLPGIGRSVREAGVTSRIHRHLRDELARRRLAGAGKLLELDGSTLEDARLST